MHRRPKSKPDCPASSPRSSCCSRKCQGSILRIFIDHPDGVTLALCERVTGHLNDYRERYSLEVSSPSVRIAR